MKKDESWKGIWSSLDCLVEQAPKFVPVGQFDNGKKDSNKGCDSPLNRKQGFLDILREKKISELGLLIGFQVGVEVNQVPFEEDGGHLPVVGVDCVDEDEGQVFYVMR